MIHSHVISSPPHAYVTSGSAISTLRSLGAPRSGRNRVVAQVEVLFFVALLCGAMFLGGSLLVMIRGGASAGAMARTPIPSEASSPQPACAAISAGAGAPQS